MTHTTRLVECADCDALVLTRQRQGHYTVLCPECLAARRRERARSGANHRCSTHTPTIETGGVRVVQDPLPVGGFEAGQMFAAYQHTINLSLCSYTEGTLLDTREGLVKVVTVVNGHCNPHQVLVPVAVEAEK